MLLSSYTGHLLEAGCDEAGRGCLAGPVFAAAVILPVDYSNDRLNDSKRLSRTERTALRDIILGNAFAWAVEMVDNRVIDEINILNASILAMHRALDQLTTAPELILVDGNRFKAYKNLPYHCIIKGDGRYQSIAAASILAKTCRDDYMESLDAEFPQYGWKKNKGYPTALHRQAIFRYGPSPYHRLSFKVSEQFKFDF
jgi:ribonuclease HII